MTESASNERAGIGRQVLRAGRGAAISCGRSRDRADGDLCELLAGPKLPPEASLFAVWVRGISVTYFTVTKSITGDPACHGKDKGKYTKATSKRGGKR